MTSGLYGRLALTGLVLTALLGAWWYVSNLQDENERLTNQVAGLGSKLKNQNDAVDTMKKDADLRLSAAAAELAKAKIDAETARKRAINIYKAKPSVPSDSCKSALDLINGGTK